MFFAGRFVEVVVDVLNGVPLTLDGLQRYLRSDHLRTVRSGYDATGPYKSLKDIERKPLFDFPGHETVPERWFNQLLLFDDGQHELEIVADLWAHVTRQYNQKFGAPQGSVHESGACIVKQGTSIVICEAGLGWASDERDDYDQMLVPWATIQSVTAHASK